MRFKNDLLKHLKPLQRLLLLYEAQADEDQAEFKRLLDTTPIFNYSGHDHKVRNTWDAITGLSLAIECDLRGLALYWFQAIRSGDVDSAREIIAKMHSTNKAYTDLLRDMGLSGKAIRAARPEMHFSVKNLLRLKGKDEVEDPEIEKMFTEMKKQVRI